MKSPRPLQKSGGNAEVGNYWGKGLKQAKEPAQTMAHFEFGISRPSLRKS